jgi:hypothetical protein
MTTETELIAETENFFKLYWKNEFGQTPKWSEHWDYNSSIPNGERRGCYALFNKEKEIVYIGVAIGKNFAEYKKTKGAYYSGGLGARLKAYWKVDKSADKKEYYKPTSKWEEVKSIKTMGFENDHYCLASALEIFLIDKLGPARNSKHTNKNIDKK